jgi:molecular chaperone GrpE
MPGDVSEEPQENEAIGAEQRLPNDPAGPASASAEVEAEPAAESQSPDQVIEALSAEVAELEDRHLRLVAEFDNFRKRVMRERALQQERSQAELVKQLLESLDDLSRVSDLGSTDHDAASILEGVQLVERKLRRALGQFGLKPIEATGQQFNPELHEAVVTLSTAHPDEDELVSQELAKGYLFNDTLLRPSLVEVKVYRPEGEEDPIGESGEAEDGT